MDKVIIDSATRPYVVLAFDGDCGFCQAAVQEIRDRANPRISAVTWRSLPEHLTQPHLLRLDREVLLFVGGNPRWGGADALARLLGSSPTRRYRAVGFCLRIPGVRLIARLAYRWVATNRHRMPAGTAACALPRPPH
ncbi:thiol-disulfide oxidoreductase DCC family protein [Streptomyces sp. NPDC091272]|uniref:thiol-disulfide oxidoreductase DCC family protein n=1 Tax=Streptomyces sp. NPDC091272 TaxID=3365981 RepID=UPI00382213AA